MDCNSSAGISEDAFLLWFKSRGGTIHPALGLTTFPGMGRGAVALRDIKVRAFGLQPLQAYKCQTVPSERYYSFHATTFLNALHTHVLPSFKIWGTGMEQTWTA